MKKSAVPAQTSGDIFTAISTAEPSTSLYPRLASTVAVPSNATKSGAVQTNNFWGNISLGDQNSVVFTHPYVLWKSTTSDFNGLAISHQTDSQKVWGDKNDHGASSYFYSAAGVMSLVLGSKDFDNGCSISLQNMKRMSIDVTLSSPNAGSLTASVLQGMGMVTAVYNDLIPEIHSQVGISSVTGGTAPKTGTDKYKIVLKDNSTWYMYVTFTDNQTCKFALKDSGHIIGSNSINNCWIQVCCGDFSDYDRAAGCYPTACTLSASTSGSTGTYALNYTTAGSGTTPLMYALPHHVASFTSKTSNTKSNASLDDTVHGTMVGYLTNVFEMSENLPTSLGMDPWSKISGFSTPNYSDDELNAIRAAASSDIQNDVANLSNLDTMYYSGKILDKFAYVLYVLYYVLKDTDSTKALLDKMKTAMNRFTNNQQINPLCYETNWGGICSTAGMAKGDTGADFGNAFYNDHHFHYGYHIHAAAITAKIDQLVGDGSWLTNNKDWVNNLVRDVANPNESDTYFPVFRNFDFFIGHSFAHGITIYSDGKDEESSSEDYNFAYAMKVWAQVIGDSNMETRANLILAIESRAIGTYMLYQSNNNAMPSNYTGNYVSGIMFENKIDHTTYFGTNEEYIHGIHMLPITPVSSLIRSPAFVKEEWENFLSSRIDGINSGWKGVLMMNVALYDPGTAYKFFSQPNFNYNYLDDGMTLTWSLAYCSGVNN
ncbi:hypothetical protein PICMEDRAFT_120385 [Pichia membranifaciens NRRL Y-2026]|uniref:glucan endo-1,3-beta-D-glucosidase n=1 Tax=Pichia membranifaciens NRRL Y-2026 TaxID=763406 RepID=A0A1E3NQ76_9ASCO|nr:hypothetical protein PICMEDRAFT_120385 [Pichia membranifaciens NRRL Y-2026]ODQ47868.1 hypothetical protein PICMEDRAFT_120385 [Pichia membranifaciens NRRL Y-2026]